MLLVKLVESFTSSEITHDLRSKITLYDYLQQNVNAQQLRSGLACISTKNTTIAELGA